MVDNVSGGGKSHEEWMNSDWTTSETKKNAKAQETKKAAEEEQGVDPSSSAAEQVAQAQPIMPAAPQAPTPPVGGLADTVEGKGTKIQPTTGTDTGQSSKDGKQEREGR